MIDFEYETMTGGYGGYNVSVNQGPWIYMSQDLYDAWLKSIGERPQPQEIIETRPGNCECGASSIGASRHAPYCPAFEK